MIKDAIKQWRLENLPNRERRESKPHPQFPDEPILDEGIPDPVFERAEPSPYTGRTRYGFVSYAETLNGRTAMLAFFGLFFLEAITGKGIVGLLGLPYDAGASFVGEVPSG